MGTVLACALATRSTVVIRELAEEAGDYLSAEAFEAAKGAASIMAMNNVYYRATHLIGDETYATLPAKLRMSIIGKPGVDKVDFELWSLAVSAINGCGRCLESHEKVVRGRPVARARPGGAADRRRRQRDGRDPRRRGRAGPRHRLTCSNTGARPGPLAGRSASGGAPTVPGRRTVRARLPHRDGVIRPPGAWPSR